VAQEDREEVPFRIGRVSQSKENPRKTRKRREGSTAFLLTGQMGDSLKTVLATTNKGKKRGPSFRKKEQIWKKGKSYAASKSAAKSANKRDDLYAQNAEKGAGVIQEGNKR